MTLILLALACRESPDDTEKTTDSVEATDADADGFVASEDCDDENALVNPAAVEACDGIDNDCDGDVDDGVLEAYARDTDGDGFGEADTSAEACEAPDGYVSDTTDCDDARDDVYPGNTETCDGLDNDCDGSTDEGVSTTYFADADADGAGSASAPVEACGPSEGYVATGDDCDDTRPDAYPGATETCDEIDNDCDGDVDEGVTTPYFLDLDADGQGSSEAGTENACAVPTGYAEDDGDCDDNDPTVYSGATEYCDGLDNDCDAAIDDEAIDASTWYADADTDGYGDALSTVAACDAPSGYGVDATDCDDTEASVNPGATERCNDIDDDCDADIDEGAADASTWYYDADSDGYGGTSLTSTACDQPGGFVATATDCDDLDGANNPGATERCDGADNDCDADIDENAADAATWYTDADGDGYGALPSTVACDAPAGAVASGDDCDDSDNGVNPLATESCNGVDDDCDGLVPADETDDADGDGLVDCDDAVHGSALSFDGDDIVTLGGTSSLTSTGGAFTVEAWFLTTSAPSTETAFVGKHVCGYSNGWFLGLNSYSGASGVAQWYFGADPRISDSTALNDGAWHHVAGTYDGAGTMALYVDGSSVGAKSTSIVTDNSYEVTLGVHSDYSGCYGHLYSGQMDEVSIWTVERSAAEVATDATTQLTGLETGLAAYYDFDDLSGQALTDMIGPYDGVLGRSSSSESSDPTWVEDSPF